MEVFFFLRFSQKFPLFFFDWDAYWGQANEQIDKQKLAIHKL